MRTNDTSSLFELRRTRDRFADGTWNKDLIVLRNLRSNQMSNCRRHQIPSGTNSKFAKQSNSKIASSIKSLQHLNHPSGTLTSADTHRNNTVFLLAFFKFVHDLHTQLSSCASKWMTQCDGSTVYIYQRWV